MAQVNATARRVGACTHQLDNLLIYKTVGASTHPTPSIFRLPERTTRPAKSKLRRTHLSVPTT